MPTCYFNHKYTFPEAYFCVISTKGGNSDGLLTIGKIDRYISEYTYWLLYLSKFGLNKCLHDESLQKRGYLNFQVFKGFDQMWSSAFWIIVIV